MNMQATILDLRYHMKEILEALERNETVEILYHGKPKGTIVPYKKLHNKLSKEHPYFGMTGSTQKTVVEEMKELRKSRYK
jgi:antitoxin (DNA-binding transcriptional repressor) of toxin-antitoxin stability system